EIIEGNMLLKKLYNEYKNDYDEFLNSLDYIAGRYVIMLIGDKSFEVFQDAVGARSIYYTLDRNVISSHIYLITDNFDYELNPLVKDIKGLDQYFDTTMFENINSLVPNFKLDFIDKKQIRFFPRQLNRYKHVSDEERVNNIMYLWK